MLIHVTTWMDLEGITKKSVTKGYMLYESIYMKCPESIKPIGTESRLVVARSWGQGGLELLSKL